MGFTHKRKRKSKFKVHIMNRPIKQSTDRLSVPPKSQTQQLYKKKKQTTPRDRFEFGFVLLSFVSNQGCQHTSKWARSSTSAVGAPCMFLLREHPESPATLGRLNCRSNRSAEQGLTTLYHTLQVGCTIDPGRIEDAPFLFCGARSNRGPVSFSRTTGFDCAEHFRSWYMCLRLRNRSSPTPRGAATPWWEGIRFCWPSSF